MPSKPTAPLNSDVRTRLAPSPTGPVHIGNIRTGIFNWLFARHNGGKFLLRIEDTDRERSTPEAVQTMLEAMDWMGLKPDEEPVYQSNNMARHLEVAEDLLARGLAFKSDFGKPELGEAIVFKMPEGAVTLNDHVKGAMTKQSKDMKDLVIVRGDGTPVFHLANVVDDIDMNVNWVIRGDDHVENTFRHIPLYQAIGAELPNYAHLPMITNPQGKPYSKRDGDAFIGEFKERGVMSDAMFNFLALLGWSPGDERELMTREEMAEAFDWDGVQSSPAQMDLKKLEWMNGEMLRDMPFDSYKEHCNDVLKQDDSPYLDKVLELMRPRVKLLAALPAQCAFFFGEEFPVDEKAERKKLHKEGMPESLAAYADVLSGSDQFEEPLDTVCQQRGLGKGKLMGALRIAVSGQGGGPDLFEVCRLLGKEKVIERIRRTVTTATEAAEAAAKAAEAAGTEGADTPAADG